MEELKILTTHINQLLRSAREHTTGLNGAEIHRREDGRHLTYEETLHNEKVRESLLLAIRKTRHAACELEAELHKLEYGYDIS